MSGHSIRGFVLAVLAISGVSGVIASAQSPLRFEVASIRPVRRGGHPLPNFVGGVQGGRVRILAMTAADLIRTAYPEFKERGRIVREPSWVRVDLFEVIATFDPRILKQKLPVESIEGDPLVPPAVRLMIRSLLEERFRLRTHVEVREMDVLDLVLADSGGRLGPALRRSTRECPTPNSGPCGIRLIKEGVPRVMGGVGVPLGRFLSFLEQTGEIDRPVRDLTGLQGLFDFEFPVYPAAERHDSRSVYSILQKLHGLKLEGRRAGVRLLVVDSLAKPSSN